MDALNQDLHGNDCFYALSNFMCAICAPSTASFLHGSIASISMTVCEPVCDHLYTSCGGVIPVANVTVSNGSEFCHQLGEIATQAYNNPVSIEAQNTSANCFTGVSDIVVKESACMAKYTNGTTSPSTSTGYSRPTTAPRTTTGTSKTVPVPDTDDGISAGLIVGLVFCVVIIASTGVAIWYYKRTHGSFSIVGFFTKDSKQAPILLEDVDDDESAFKDESPN